MNSRNLTRGNRFFIEIQNTIDGEGLEKSSDFSLSMCQFECHGSIKQEM